jgi:uncharacterized membrane protein
MTSSLRDASAGGLPMDTADAPIEVQTPDDAASQAGRLVRGAGGWLRDDRAPIVAVVALMAVWILVMGRLIVLRQQNFGTADFDTGIYDQYIWQAAHGRFENTVRGISFFGNHAQFGLFFFVPFAWLGGGPSTWDILHTIALAATALPLYLLARDKLGRPWLCVGVAVVWLANPTVQWLVQEGFRLEGMAVPFLVGTFLFGERLLAERADGAVSRRTRLGFGLCFVLAICWKEDVALALAGMGLVWVLRRHWRFGAAVVAVASAWVILFGVLMVPRVAGGSTFGGVYDLGATPSEILLNSAKDPSRLVEKLDENNAPGYAGSLAQPYGFVPLLSPVTLLIGLPQWSINIVSASAWTFDLRFHYQAIPSAALAISLVGGLAWLRRWRWRSLEPLVAIALTVALAVALLATRWYGPSPLGNDYELGIWPLHRPHNYQSRVTALAYVPSDAGVASDFNGVPHLTHREIVYTFPNPWRPQNYGVTPDEVGDPAEVSWIVLNARNLGGNGVLLKSILASGEFEVRFSRDGIVALERIAPPGGGTAPIDTG